MWIVLYRDLYVPIWPNLAASAISTLPALALLHAKHRKHLAHISTRLADLHERLTAPMPPEDET